MSRNIPCCPQFTITAGIYFPGCFWGQLTKTETVNSTLASKIHLFIQQSMIDCYVNAAYKKPRDSYSSLLTMVVQSSYSVKILTLCMCDCKECRERQKWLLLFSKAFWSVKSHAPWRNLPFQLKDNTILKTIHLAIWKSQHLQRN